MATRRTGASTLAQSPWCFASRLPPIRDRGSLYSLESSGAERGSGRKENMRITEPQFGAVALAAVGIAFACVGPAAHAQAAEHYQNFNSAIYIPVDDMRRMAADPKFMQDSFDVVHASIKFNKVWLETFRGSQEVSEADVRKVKQFFESKGIRTSGGIMAVLGAPGDGIRSFCWSNPAHRERFRKLVAFSAANFDELIFDDLFMYNCRCDLCQRARGNRSWTEFRGPVFLRAGTPRGGGINSLYLIEPVPITESTRIEPGEYHVDVHDGQAVIEI